LFTSLSVVPIFSVRNFHSRRIRLYRTKNQAAPENRVDLWRRFLERDVSWVWPEGSCPQISSFPRR